VGRYEFELLARVFGRERDIKAGNQLLQPGAAGNPKSSPATSRRRRSA
jgi:hypothetical protein